MKEALILVVFWRVKVVSMYEESEYTGLRLCLGKRVSECRVWEHRKALKRGSEAEKREWRTQRLRHKKEQMNRSTYILNCKHR